MHLHLLIHGMQGHPRHVAEAARIFTTRHSAVHLLVPSSFTYTHTYDGIDANAERVLHEVHPVSKDQQLSSSPLKKLDEAVLTLEKDPAVRITKLSVTGYSLGGLIARYVVGCLYSRGFFDSVDAANFTTFTTPHVGIPPHPYTSRILFWLGSTVLGRTGTQLHLLDTWSDTERPLLQAMTHPDSAF
ncbi:putative serine esterase-domain-containing protein [Mycena vulgaris]|nr:putative serine esterase-domain-containing protein [Mycena vulgaris]